VFGRIISALFLLTFVVGCSPYLDDFRYVPRPALAEVPATPPQTAPPLSVFASVIGVRYDSPQEQLPDCVEVRLQLNNNGPQTVTFDPRSMTLSDGTLSAFAPPILRPPGTVTLSPTQSTSYSAYFPFQPGRDYDNTDLSSLQLRWTVQLDGRNVSQTAIFNRSVRYYYYSDPYPYYPYPYWGPVYGGVIIVHRH